MLYIQDRSFYNPGQDQTIDISKVNLKPITFEQVLRQIEMRNFLSNANDQWEEVENTYGDEED